MTSMMKIMMIGMMIIKANFVYLKKNKSYEI